MSDAISPIVGGFALFLAGLCALALFVKACFEILDEANTWVLALLGLATSAVGVGLVPSARSGFGIFCLILAGLSGFVLAIKAILNSGHLEGGMTLFALLVILGGAGWMLINGLPH